MNNWIEQDSDDVVLLEPNIPWYTNLQKQKPIAIIEKNDIHNYKIKFDENNNDKKCKQKTIEDFGGKCINKISDKLSNVLLSCFVISLVYFSFRKEE